MNLHWNHNTYLSTLFVSQSGKANPREYLRTSSNSALLHMRASCGAWTTPFPPYALRSPFKHPARLRWLFFQALSLPTLSRHHLRICCSHWLISCVLDSLSSLLQHLRTLPGLVSADAHPTLSSYSEPLASGQLLSPLPSFGQSRSVSLSVFYHLRTCRRCFLGLHRRSKQWGPLFAG